MHDIERACNRVRTVIKRKKKRSAKAKIKADYLEQCAKDIAYDRAQETKNINSTLI